ncbi:MAG: restriction endonuclease subunit S [Clostridiaceae bacterium]|nr:restriction endonuclease subunit S [Clostridiaceae bacterium]
MSRLEELIAELCPDGVEYLPIKSCVENVENIKWATVGGKRFQYIDLTSVDRDTHLIGETQIIHNDNAPSRAQQIVVKGDILLGATRPMLKRYCMIGEDYDSQICSTGFCVLRANPTVVLRRWLYHHITSTAFFDHVERFQKGASYPAISDADVKAYKVPVPPLPVQREIVRILDNFTELTAELTAELAAELTARKKQYEYYRDALLKLPDYPRLLLKDISSSVSSGKNKERLDDGEFPVYGSTGVISSTDTAVYHKKQILIARVGANAGYVHIARGDYDVSDNTLIVDMKSDVSFQYVYYQLSSMNLHQYAKGGGQPLVTAGQLKEISIPIPPIEEQNKIVEILNRFYTLCNDLTAGLPAEIAARQKQYEYYRDKLLTFKELA